MFKFVDYNRLSIVRAYPVLVKGLWILLILLLPITSLPLLLKLLGGETVNPASALPLFALFIFWFLPHVLRNGSLPVEVSPLMGFIVAAVISSAAAFFLNMPPFKGQTIVSREVPGLLTIGTGVVYYLVTITILKRKEDLTLTLKLINLSGILMLIWTLIQGIVILFFDGNYPEFMQTFHGWLSIRKLQPGRVMGFAYEPSWLANQLNILYFPLWLGMLVFWQTIYQRRIWRIPLEALFVIGGIAAIFLAHSRIGLFGLLSLFGFLVLRFAFRASILVRRRLEERVNLRFSGFGKWAGLIGFVILWVLTIAIFIGLALSAIYLASQLDWRLENFFKPGLIKSALTDIQYLFSYQFSRALKFAERTAYWEAGFRIFSEHPFLGVGLGNSGFFFVENIPTYGWRAPEVVQIIRPDNHIFPNSKNLWIRLLAETGIVGFTFFVVWLVAMFSRVWQLMNHKDQLYKILGLTGVLGIIAIIVEGFSLDTFGLPYMWVLLGLVSAAARISKPVRRSS